MKSLLHKLLLSSLVIILLPMGLAILWTSRTLSTVLEHRFAEKSRAQAEQVELLLSEKQETATGLVHWIAEMPGVRDALKKKDRTSLFQHLLPLVGSVQMDFIEIMDPGGRIFLRVHDPSVYGDTPALAKDVQGLLHKTGDMSNYGVEERAGRAYLRAAESIEGDNILGVVSAGYAVNRDFIKRLEQIAGGKVVIAIGNRLYTSDAPGQAAKQPAVETAASALTEESQWHRDDPSPSLEIRLPLTTDRGTEGAISIFYPTREMTAAIGSMRKTLFSVALLGAALAFFISWILSRRLTRPLKELVSGTDQVAAGIYSASVSMNSKDEIGALAASFNRMLEELSRSKAEVESYRQELERKFAERSKELAETEKKRAAMAHMIAHDLKNPLLGIKKTLERLDQASPETNGGKKILQDLVSAGDLVIGMVNEMLDIYRSDFGDLPLALSPLRIDELVQTSLHILGPEIEEKQIEVVIRNDAPDISLVADKRRLTRLLINLLSNAIKFSPQQKRIEISTSLVGSDQGRGPRAVIRVEDQGEGIPERDLSRIFDAFYSRDQGKLETGTGLGLPYCKLVAEAHRGKIWAECHSGGGFAVSVALPLNPEEEQQPYADQDTDRR